MYLSDAYAKEDDLYPKENKKRAMVNQRLFFDTAILFPRLKSVTVREMYLTDIETNYINT